MKIPIQQYNRTVLLAEQVRVGLVGPTQRVKALPPERKAKLEKHFQELLMSEDFRINDEGLAKLRRTQGELKLNYLRAVALLRETIHMEDAR